jgi:hypothetical protein
MRILTLGCPLPHIQIDNYNWASALSFFDYDAIVIDPAEAISKLIEDVTGGAGSYTTYTGEPIVDGPTSEDAVGLSDLLRQRREEVERLLARGGLVICFGYADVAHPKVAGFTGCHRYYWLPAPTGADYGRSYIQSASGIHVKAMDFQHPFADLLEEQRNNFLYRAVFSEGAKGFGEDARVFGRSTGGAPVALDLKVGGGRVIFLPALPPNMSMRDRVANAIVAAVRNTLLLSAEEEAPDWLDDYSLPGLEPAREQMEAAETRIEEIESELAEARREYLGLDRYRRLLWQQGKFGFDLPVRDALALIGCRSVSDPDDAAVFNYKMEEVLVETESSPNVVGMEPHYRLRERLEAKIVDSARRVRGLIVINGFREEPPDQRPQQYEDALRVAAESMRYCVVDATRLFQAVQDQMEGRTEAVEAFCRSLLDTEGVLTATTRASDARAASASD